MCDCQCSRGGASYPASCQRYPLNHPHSQDETLQHRPFHQRAAFHSRVSLRCLSHHFPFRLHQGNAIFLETPDHSFPVSVDFLTNLCNPFRQENTHLLNLLSVYN